MYNDFVTQDNIKWLSDKWGVSTFDIIEAIKRVGRCQSDVLDYLKNNTVAIARKDSGFVVYYSAIMVEQKNYEISKLVEIIEQDKSLIKSLNQRIKDLEESAPDIKFPFIREYTTDNYTQYQVIYEKGGIVSTCCFRDKRDEAVAFLEYLKDTQNSK